jgi:hypothetical protein
MSCILRPWLNDIPFKMQAILLSALRGCDGVSKNDPSKPLIRHLRYLILLPADPMWEEAGSTFFGHQPTPDQVKAFWDCIDQYPLHFFMHLLGAIQCLGYKHPDPAVQEFWFGLYVKGVGKLYLNIETQDHFNTRLQNVDRE